MKGAIMKSRYEKRFAELGEKGEKAFIPFVVLGDPDEKTSFEILKRIAKSADCLELGIPFSDPIADGKTIQAADQRALDTGMNTDKAFKLIAKMRKHDSEIPIGLLVYYNLVYRRGITKFYKDAKKAGVDGILIADMPIEESVPALKVSKRTGIDQIFLITQTTGNERMKKIAEKAAGFIYIVALLGVTGARTSLKKATLELVKRASKFTKLPLCVGFGVSKPDHAKALVKSGADGVIVGSAVEKVIEKNIKNKRKMLKAVSNFCEKMRRATKSKKPNPKTKQKIKKTNKKQKTKGD